MEEGLLSVFDDGEWDSSDRNFLNDDADFMLHQLFSNEVGEGSSSSPVAPVTWSFLENDNNLTEAGQRSIYTELNHLSTQYGFSGHREFGQFTSQLNSSNVHSEYYKADVVVESPVTFFLNDVPETVPFRSELEMSRVEPDIHITIPNTPLNLKRNLDMSTSEVPKKKTRTTKNDGGNKTKALSKKTMQMSMNNGCDFEPINSSKQMSTLSYSSEDDSNASQEFNAETSSYDKNGKKKGRRGSAIDPQSLYARKRRERINERLRILQNLVPNGTKVDISTMLEEAVSYVKFLQTQIKLLSSDDLWMYAPIAYNGVDVGLDWRLSQNL